MDTIKTFPYEMQEFNMLEDEIKDFCKNETIDLIDNYIAIEKELYKTTRDYKFLKINLPFIPFCENHIYTTSHKKQILNMEKTIKNIVRNANSSKDIINSIMKSSSVKINYTN